MEYFILWLIYNIHVVCLAIALLAAVILLAIILVAYGLTPRYSNDEIRRQLVAEGRALSDWTVKDGVPSYRSESGEVVAFVGENQIHTTAVANYLLQRNEYLRQRDEHRK